MTTSGNFISFGSSRLHYHRWGRGDKLLLCFHGYGESAVSFAFLAETLGDEFTILAIDLPYHGKTEWNEYPATVAPSTSTFSATSSAPAGCSTLSDTSTASGSGQTLPFTVDHLLSILETLLSTLDIPAITHWYLMGYSMGGRIALSLLQAAPDRVARLILVAPDGLRVNPWYWLATQTLPGRLLFRYTMFHPGWFFFVLRTGNALKLVNRSIYKFVAHYIDNPGIRHELFMRWTGLRKFRPHLPVIKDIILQRRLPVRILYGRFDRIIRVKRGEEFRKGIEPYCRLMVLAAGHQLLQSTHLGAFLSLLKE
jgi:pimeloyl-ACP methyl ester carboxylesterase